MCLFSKLCLGIHKRILFFLVRFLNKRNKIMNNHLSSITKGPRQSNFELLRIIAMLLVLVVHADFLANGTPSSHEFISDPLNAFTRTVIQSIAIVCVNVFVLISGWFGIKPSLKGISSFIFQCLFFYVGIYIINVLFFKAPVSIIELRKCLFFAPESGLWFVLAYVMLYILSPILNTFINSIPKIQYKRFLMYFIVFQSFIWMGGVRPFLNRDMALYLS